MGGGNRENRLLEGVSFASARVSLVSWIRFTLSLLLLLSTRVFFCCITLHIFLLWGRVHFCYNIISHFFLSILSLSSYPRIISFSFVFLAKKKVISFYSLEVH